MLMFGTSFCFGVRIVLPVMFQGYVQQRQNMGPRPPVPVAMMAPTNTVYSQQQMTAAVYLQQSMQPAQQFMTGQPQVLNYMPGGQMQMQVSNSLLLQSHVLLLGHPCQISDSFEIWHSRRICLGTNIYRNTPNLCYLGRANSEIWLWEKMKK